ncbi:MAG: PAS domain-containing sensor histidine kinase, partial [Bacteroides acidifaciens]|nr:PAS domain-containing sensor histidine kinase [Bacteroides acidifaciens]
STLDTVEQALSTEEGMDDICDVMRVCTERCFSMSRFITRFADVVKIPEPTVSPVNLNDLAFTCKRFMEGMCNDRHIKLRMEPDESLKDVMVDAALFEQVLVNIIKNAVESIETDAESIRTDGEIIIRTLSPATIEITDNGKGISKETEAKLFSPFFSTKPNGQGIGLIFIREVLMRHGCTFSLRTYADGLTKFQIVFP